jgi:hypothetical protein
VEAENIGWSVEHGNLATAVRWLQSAVPPVWLVERLKDSCCFTLVTTVATDDTSQSGPARIISLSKDPTIRNFMLAQDNGDLVFRLRTPATGENGTNPELRIPNVFVGEGRQRIRVIYDGASLSVHVNGEQRSAPYKISPGYVAMKYLPVIGDLNVSMALCQIVYNFMAFFPLGLLTQSSVISRRARHQIHLTVLFVCVAASALEIVLVLLSGKPFDYLNVGVSAISAVVGIATGRLLARRAVDALGSGASIECSFRRALRRRADSARDHPGCKSVGRLGP